MPRLGGCDRLRPAGADLPQGPTTIMLEADNVDDCYSRLARKPGLHVYEHIADRPYGIRLFQLLDPDENVIVIFSWSRDVMEYQHGWQPTVPGMFRGEYRAVAYVDVADYEEPGILPRYSQAPCMLYLGLRNKGPGA